MTNTPNLKPHKVKEKAGHSRRTRYLFLIGKFIVAGGLCYLILSHADFEGIKTALLRTNISILILVLFSMLLNIVVSAKKWQILLNIHGIFFSLKELTRIYMIAGFFSNFLPSTIGGDGYRIFKTGKHQGFTSGVVLSVITDRIFGITVLFFLGFLSAILSYIRFRDSVSNYGIIFGGCGMLLILFLLGMISSKRPRIWFLNQQFIPAKIKQFSLHIEDYRRGWRKFICFLGMSAIFYVFLFGYRLALIRTLGEDCPIYSLAMVIMISNILATLPISINGLGILDGSFIFLINHFGVTYETGLMVMILHRMLVMLISLIGGILYGFDKEAKALTNYSVKEELKPVKD